MKIRHSQKHSGTILEENPNLNLSFRDLRLTDGSLTDTDEETAQCFNCYFASVFTREDPSQISLLPLEHQDMALLSDISIQDSHILEILDNLKVNKAAGPNGIHPRTLHETRFQIDKPLWYLFTKSSEQGTIPRDWKDAVVVPIYKNGRMCPKIIVKSISHLLLAK